MKLSDPIGWFVTVWLTVLFAVCVFGCDQTPIEGPTPCPGRFDIDLSLPCATSNTPESDTYGPFDGMWIEDGYFVVPTCEVCEPEQP